MRSEAGISAGARESSVLGIDNDGVSVEGTQIYKVVPFSTKTNPCIHVQIYDQAGDQEERRERNGAAQYHQRFLTTCLLSTSGSFMEGKRRFMAGGMEEKPRVSSMVYGLLYIYDEGDLDGG